MIDKDKIIEQLKEKVEKELNQLKAAYKVQKELVQRGDLKSDGKYDTRATEANYLADGQRKRITELELQLLDEIDIKHSPKNVSIGSVVEIKLNKQIQKYFIAPTAGGTMLNIEGIPILVISVFSPIGDGILGLEQGEGFEIEIKDTLREYQVVSFY